MQESGTVWDISIASHTLWDLLHPALKPSVTCDWNGGISTPIPLAASAFQAQILPSTLFVQQPSGALGEE